MNIIINKNKDITDTFLRWLLKELKNEIVATMDIDKLESLTNHTEEIFGVRIDVNEAILVILKNIKIQKLENYYVLNIANNVKFNGIPIINLYNYINFGTLQVRGYPFISNILSNLNINKYLLKYRLVGV